MTQTTDTSLAFALDYSTMRERFLSAARAAGAALSEHVHPLHGPDGKPITTDVALIGQADAPKLMILISGTHGVEGAYGSACQTAWLNRKADCVAVHVSECGYNGQRKKLRDEEWSCLGRHLLWDDARRRASSFLWLKLLG